jgi:RWD domain
VLEREPRIIFKIAVATEDFAEIQDGLTCDLVFTFPVKYPDEAPLIAVEEDNFEDDLVKEKLTDSILALIEENLGTEMIFTLVAGAQELMNLLFDDIKAEREAAKYKKEQEIEEAERKRFEGTRVSQSNAVATSIS